MLHVTQRESLSSQEKDVFEALKVFYYVVIVLFMWKDRRNYI